MGDESRNFPRAAEDLLHRLGLPAGAVTLQETRRDNLPEIIAHLESGARPKETPDKVKNFAVVYRTRRVLKAR
ncbi:MAG: hypothetical protein AAF141_09450 [Pseudomonadota bacterium]